MRPRRLLPLLTLLAVPVGLASGQQPMQTTTTPTLNGTRATADLPASQHHRNTAGADGSGLCVYTSTWHSSLWQSVSDLYGFRDWMQAREGGSFPEKFDEDLQAYCREKGIPVPGYVQHTGGDVEFLKQALKTGRMVGITYCGDDVFYGAGRVIGHMVNLVYIDDHLACVLDNNDPGKFRWMTAAQLVARWRGVQEDGRPYLAEVRDRFGRVRMQPVGGGWAIVLLASPPPPYATQPVAAAGCPCGDGCGCDGECPAACPAGPRVMVGQCEGGRCQLPQPGVPVFQPFVQVLPHGQPVPRLPEIPGTTRINATPVPFSPGHWVRSETPVPAAQHNGLDHRPWGDPPGPDYCWLFRPGVGWGWVDADAARDLGLRQPDPGQPAEPRKVEHAGQAGAAPGRDYPPDGVISSKLAAETRYWVNGQPCSKGEACKVLALELTDDSGRWNLTAVGDPAFLARVKDDVSKLPVGTRDRIHLQTYDPASWQALQFQLQAGVTLRKPAVGRVGADAGQIPAGNYSAEQLATLVGQIDRRGPAPSPPPNAEPAPDQSHANPAPPPAPGRDLSALVAAVLAGLILVLTVLKQK